MKKEELAGIMLLDDGRYSHRESLKEAYHFFDVLSGAGAKDADAVTFRGANKIGAVDLVCLTNKEGNLGGDGDLELTSVMESLTNILVAAIMNKAGGDPEKLVNQSLWEKGSNALTSMVGAGYSRNTIHYVDKVIGAETANEVVSIAFDVYGEPEGHLKNEIASYLKAQGELMSELGYDGTLNNPYTLIGFSNFVKDSRHRCCFTAYFTTFSVKTAKITRSCREPKKEFEFDFMVTRCNAEFMLARWETDPAFKQAVKNFIKDHPYKGDFFDDWDTGTKIKDVPSS
jgi:hypothetical protein